MQDQIININTIHLQSLGNCGYCENRINGKWTTTSFQCKSMKAEDYHTLINRGWRRCGTDYYKPNTEECCKQHRPYNIRLNTLDFKKKPSQQITLNKLQRYRLQGKLYTQIQKSKQASSLILSDQNNQDLNFLNQKMNVLKKYIMDQKQKIISKINSQVNIMGEIVINEHVFSQISVFIIKSCIRFQYGQYGCNIIILIYFYNRSLFQQYGIEMSKFVEFLKPFIEEFLSINLPEFQIHIQSNGYMNFKNQTPVFKQKQQHVQQKQDQKEIKKPLNFEMKLVKAQFEEDSYNIYKKYNQEVHKQNRESKDSYIDFLCLQALEEQTILNENNKKLNLGCHHMKYFLDNQLVAVGVVDILPEGLSQVHFFYDPSYKKLRLGVLGSLKEIEFIQEYNKLIPKFKYHYMGIFIQNCQKMVYKGENGPSELLCPIKFQFVQLNTDKTLNILKSENSMIAENLPVLPDMDFDEVNLEEFIKNEIKLNINGKQFKIKSINPGYQKYFTQIFRTFVQYVGKTLSQKFIFGQF